MRLKTLFCAGLLAAGAVSTASADDLTWNVPMAANLDLDGAYSGAWGATHAEAGEFTDTYTLVGVESGGYFSSVLSTIGFADSFDIDFTSVTVNGQAFELTSPNQVDLATFSQQQISGDGPLTLVVSGIAAPNLDSGTTISASYSGMANVSAVPEPHSLALMLAGLGVVATLGRRRLQR